CRDKLKKGNAVLVDGELQSRTFKTDEQQSRTVVEIKARRIQFLNKRVGEKGDAVNDEPSVYSDDSFDSLLSPEDSDLIKS
ncbi:MAG TPA: single-stranded DNA-binding protein, partial [Bacteroidetes bacterium]|nr:single-stranded DNA-binding protein [Bacteroidota bacterium]